MIVGLRVRSGRRRLDLVKTRKSCENSSFNPWRSSVITSPRANTSLNPVQIKFLILLKNMFLQYLAVPSQKKVYSRHNLNIPRGFRLFFGRRHFVFWYMYNLLQPCYFPPSGRSDKHSVLANISMNKVPWTENLGWEDIYNLKTEINRV